VGIAEHLAVRAERDAVVRHVLALRKQRDRRVGAAGLAERVGDRRPHREPDEDGDHPHRREHHEQALEPLTALPPPRCSAEVGYGTDCCHAALKSLPIFV
jgi:hypothetical protein